MISPGSSTTRYHHLQQNTLDQAAAMALLQGQYPQSAGVVGMISPRNHIYQSNSANSHNSLQNTSQQSGASSHRKSMRGLERYNAATASNSGVGKATSYSKQRATKN